MNHARGFIFLLTLTILSVMQLFILTITQGVLMYYKAVKHREMAINQGNALETVAYRLIKNPSSKACHFPAMRLEQSIQAPTNSACNITLKKKQYDYRIEDLGVFPCFIAYQNKKPYATQHFRISVFTREKRPVSVLQIRLIQAVPYVECLEKIHPAKIGISSWRYLK